MSRGRRSLTLFTKVNLGVGLALLVLTFAIPSLISDTNLIRIFTLANTYVMFAISWDILSGFTGQVNFGHAAFIGGGGFAVGLLSKYAEGLGPVLQLLLATGVAALLGLAIGVPALRLKGPYLALATLAVGTALIQLTFSFKTYAGGEDGIRGIDGFDDGGPIGAVGSGLARLLVPGYADARPLDQRLLISYYVVLIFMALMLAGLLALGYSKRGLVLRSIQQDELAAEAGGVNIVAYKLGAFVLSAACAGLAGGLLVIVRQSVALDVLAVDLSLIIIVIAALGGVGSIFGPAVGAYVVVWLQDYYLEKIGAFEKHPELKPALFSVILILILRFLPRGIAVPPVQALRRRLAPARSGPGGVMAAGEAVGAHNAPPPEQDGEDPVAVSAASQPDGGERRG